MRRFTALVLSIMLCLAFCSCTGSSKETSEDVLDIRAKYIGAESLDFTLLLTAESGGRVYDFKLRFQGNDENGSMEIIEPENIAGLKATIKDGRASLEFDGIAFDIGKLLGDVSSPMEAVPHLIEAWKSERISSAYAEKQDGILLTVMESAIGSAGCTQKTWFGGDMLPVHAEIYADGKKIISCRFESATF